MGTSVVTSVFTPRPNKAATFWLLAGIMVASSLDVLDDTQDLPFSAGKGAVNSAAIVVSGVIWASTTTVTGALLLAVSGAVAHTTARKSVTSDGFPVASSR